MRRRQLNHEGHEEHEGRVADVFFRIFVNFVAFVVNKKRMMYWQTAINDQFDLDSRVNDAEEASVCALDRRLGFDGGGPTGPGAAGDARRAG